MKNPTILAIETSLDDTCAAVTSGLRVISNVVSSQTSYHADWGGTVPDIAKRLHQEWLPKVVDRALRQAGIDPETLENRNTGIRVNAVAVTYGPGLAPSLEQGIEYSKQYAVSHKLPLIAVNHMEGHLLAPFARRSRGEGGSFVPKYPALGFLISGGHTQLVLMHEIGKYELLGETLDDAAGEAYDKVARMLQLGYPGGPILAEMAKSGTPHYPLPEPMTARADLDFSFSGLKTQARYFLEKEKPALTKEFIQDFAASFEAAVLKHLLRRLKRAIELHSPQMLLLGGGVVSNIALRTACRKLAREYGLPTHIPYSKKLITDNAAMIGIAAYYQYLRNDFADPNKLDRLPNLNFSLKES